MKEVVMRRDMRPAVTTEQMEWTLAPVIRTPSSNTINMKTHKAGQSAKAPPGGWVKGEHTHTRLYTPFS